MATRSEGADIEIRMCELAVEIREAQRREISETDWPIDDIERNGVAAPAQVARARPVLEYAESAERQSLPADVRSAPPSSAEGVEPLAVLVGGDLPAGVALVEDLAGAAGGARAVRRSAAGDGPHDDGDERHEQQHR
jgi:hypothetical protein